MPLRPLHTLGGKSPSSRPAGVVRLGSHAPERRDELVEVDPGEARDPVARGEGDDEHAPWVMAPHEYTTFGT